MTGGLPGTGMSNPGIGMGPSRMGATPDMGFPQNAMGTNPNYPIGPGTSGGMGPQPAGQAWPAQITNDRFMAPPTQATGQSIQANGTVNPPQPVQPPNAVTNQVPGVGSKPPVSGPKPPTMKPPSMMPPQPAGQQNKMTVHNPTGTGSTVASQMAAAQRPIPANQPTKKIGAVPPAPANIPGKPAGR